MLQRSRQFPVPAFAKSRTLRFAAIGSAIALAVTALSAPAAFAADDDYLELADVQPTLIGTDTALKTTVSELAETPDDLLTRQDPGSIPVLIKYDYDAVASYAGGISGFAPTSPRVTKRKFSSNGAAERKYRDYIAGRERSITAGVEAAVPEATVRESFENVYGGVAAVVPGNRIAALLAVPGVVAVQHDTLNQPLTDSSPGFIGADPVYGRLGTTKDAGAGLILGNIDTGVWPEHPSFADDGTLPDYDGPALPCDFGDNPLTPDDDPFVCNNKLIGGYFDLNTYAIVNGADSYTYPLSARDAEGHGSHTASTSAGDIVGPVQPLGGPVVDHVQGIAPGAEIIEYRVCGPLGCYGSDSVAAIEQAIVDGVDAINFSIGGGTDPTTDPVELAFLDAYNAGVFVAASAGNDGPGAGTANHLAPWLVSVSASTQSRQFSTTLTLAADDGAVFTVPGASITSGLDPLPIVLASEAPYGDALCQTPAAAGLFAGKIVVCERGVNGRVDKGYNVAQGDAAGMILYNPALADVETDNHWLPAVHVADGTDLVAFIAAHTGIVASFPPGAASTGQGDVMAAFSSRGPAGLFIKPDITAPGVQILAAMTPTPDGTTTGPSGEYYQAIAGTSMASPHIAGAALLIKSVHPDWTPGQIKSAMMTQSITTVLKEDASTPADAFDMGAGRIDVGAAVAAPLTISEDASDFAAYSGDPLGAIHLNIPSIDAPIMPGRVSTVRTLTNVTGKTLEVTAKAKTGAGSTITVSPSRFTIKPGKSASVRVTIASSLTDGSQQFGTISLDTRAGDLHLPVAFVPKQGSLSTTQTCAADSVTLGATTTCEVAVTNNAYGPQDVRARTTTDANLSLVGAGTATATLQGNRLGVPSLGAGSTPAGGYLPLSLFGVSPQSIGDEQIANYNVPSFVYNGKPYSRIGITSNGYLVVGGGDSTQVSFEPPAGPSGAAPNNVLAPFWTDLDGTGAPGYLISTLTDGVNSWIVVEWQVRDWGTSNLRTFQVWIGEGTLQDVSFGYAADQTAPPGGAPYLVGAENEIGEGDMQPVLPTLAGYAVTSSDPLPGELLTYTVKVSGKRVGDGTVHTEVRGSEVLGTTIVESTIDVEKKAVTWPKHRYHPKHHRPGRGWGAHDVGFGGGRGHDRDGGHDKGSGGRGGH